MVHLVKNVCTTLVSEQSENHEENVTTAADAFNCVNAVGSNLVLIRRALDCIRFGCG